MSKSERLRSIVAQGWTMMFIVFLANLTIDVVKSLLVGNAANWVGHMGLFGIQVVLGISVIAAAVMWARQED